MRSEALAPTRATERSFSVVWQDPESRKFCAVGRLDLVHRGPEIVSCRFSYRSDARAHVGFEPFLAFPDLDAAYERDGDLFPFFANRVMSARRPDFTQYAKALGLSAEEADPVEILARSAGERATDTIHVVPEPRVLDDGTEERLFLVSGVRHTQGVDARISGLSSGDELHLKPNPENAASPRAMLVSAAEGEPVGWVPDYLLDYLHKHRDVGRRVRILVERANGSDVPSHLRLLCRMRVSPVESV